MNTTLVKPVVTKIERDNFINFPYILNKGNSLWVPPLRVSLREILDDKNNFWLTNDYQLFLAYQGTQIVGRIAAFINVAHNAHFRSKVGFFGFLEAIDSTDVFAQLFQRAESFLKERGYTSLIGPMNPTIHHEIGVLIDGFHLPPNFMLTYNSTYYDERIKQAGYCALKDFYAYKLNTPDFILSNKIARVKNSLQKKYSVTLRSPNLNDFLGELKIFHEIYNDAFEGHWGFAPIGWEDFKFLGKDMKMVLDKEMVLIAEMNDKPIGFLLAIPNLNEALMKIPDGKLFPFGIFKLFFYKSRVKSLRVITVAIKREFQHLGIGSILYPEIATRAKQRGYSEAELSWVVEDNVRMNKMCLEMGGVITKKYRLYEKPLDDTCSPN